MQEDLHSSSVKLRVVEMQEAKVGRKRNVVNEIGIVCDAKIKGKTFMIIKYNCHQSPVSQSIPVANAKPTCTKT